MDAVHVPVLLKEAIDSLAVESGKNYIDATVGFGGHSKEILSRNGASGVVIGIDLDDEMLIKTRARLIECGDRFIPFSGSYVEMERFAKDSGVDQFHGVLMDLGMSSFQLDSSGRGFSFQKDEPLDMRFGRTEDRQSASEILNEWTERELIRIFKEYGEERYTVSIVRSIIQARRISPVVSTSDLVSLIERSVPGAYRHRRIHCATKTFQALRMAVNNELETISLGLESALRLLRVGGRLVVISFHSLEDSLVKNFMKKVVFPCVCPPDFPRCVCGQKPLAVMITKKAIKPTEVEIQKNPRSRSARMRVIEKI